jgi:hypothetical protein
MNPKRIKLKELVCRKLDGQLCACAWRHDTGQKLHRDQMYHGGNPTLFPEVLCAHSIHMQTVFVVRVLSWDILLCSPLKDN